MTKLAHAYLRFLDKLQFHVWGYALGQKRRTTKPTLAERCWVGILNHTCRVELRYPKTYGVCPADPATKCCRE